MTGDCYCVRCHEVVEAEWAFCPYCGADNRDPHLQLAVPDHRHMGIPAGQFCLICGHKTPREGNPDGWRIWVTAAILLFAAVANLAAFTDVFHNVELRDWLVQVTYNHYVSRRAFIPILTFDVLSIIAIALTWGMQVAGNLN